MRGQIVGLCLIVGMLLLVPISVDASTASSSAPAAAIVPVTLSLAPSSNAVTPGSTFSTDVRLEMQAQSHAISVVKLKLDFDPLVFHPTAITLNSAIPQLELLEQTGLDSQASSVGLILEVGSDPQAALLTSASLATVTFQVVGASGSSSWITWETAEALSVSSGDSATDNVVGTAQGAFICVGSGNCGAPDTTLPSVTWVSPVTTQGEVYEASNGTLNLEVLPADSSGISSVAFSRWDAVNAVVVSLGAAGSSPYKTTLDVSTLNPGWNEIDADVYDNAHNQNYTYFWINRSVTPTAVTPVISPSGEDGTNVLLTWQHAENNTRYEVWEGAGPYFVPGDSGVLLGQVTASPWSYEDLGALGDPNVDHFYRVRSYNGNASADSGQVGEFDFSLVSGAP